MRKGGDRTESYTVEIKQGIQGVKRQLSTKSALFMVAETLQTNGPEAPEIPQLSEEPRKFLPEEVKGRDQVPPHRDEQGRSDCYTTSCDMIHANDTTETL